MTAVGSARLIAGRRPAATVMGIAVILAGVVAALALLGPAPANLMVGAGVMLLFDLVGIGVAVGTARHTRRAERAAFACIAAIFLLWAASRVAWLVGLIVDGEMPTDVPALQAIWAMVAALGVGAILLIYVHHRDGSSWAGPLDAAVVALALAVVLWNLYVSDGDAGVERVTTTAYFALVGGVAAALGAMMVWRRSSVHRWLRWAVLAVVPLGGDMALSIAAADRDDTALRGLAMAVGILALGLIITTAVVRRREPAHLVPTSAVPAPWATTRRRSRIARAVPAAALIGAMATIAWGSGVPGILAIAAVALLIVRVVGSQRTVEQLLDERSRWALTDQLTGVRNRRLFEYELSLLDARMQRQEIAASLIALDLDHFKQVNDAHGHSVGDVLLREVAAALAGTLRDGDQLFRLGGDEFIALLPATMGADAERIGDRLRVAVAAAAMRVLPDGPRVTASVGVAEVPPGEDGVERARESADRALYAAKRRGRNRVITAGIPVGPEAGV